MTTEQLALIDQLAKQAKGQQYKSSKADQQIAINSAADITPEIQLQLTQFVASLLNPLRQQLGNTPYTISQGALDFAQQIANNYQTWAKHDVATITEEAGLFGLDDGGNYYEDLGSGYIDRSTKNDWENTLDGIKKGIYNTIIDMLFNDAGSAYGHAGSVLGYRKSLNDNQIYFGVSIDKNGQDHFIGVGSSYIEAPSKFNTTTTYDVPVVDVAALKSQAQALSSELAQKTAVSTAANQSLTDAQAAFATAQATLSTSEQALAAAKATTTNAEAALSQATEKAAQAATQVATDTQAVAAAQAKVDALNADQQTKLAALASAKADLAAAQDVLSSLQETSTAKGAVLTNAIADRDRAIANLKSAQDAVTSLQAQITNQKAYIVTLQQAPEILKSAEATLASAKAAYSKAQADLSDAQVPYQQALATLETAKVALTKAQADLTAKQNRLDQLEAVKAAAEAAERQKQAAAQETAQQAATQQAAQLTQNNVSTGQNDQATSVTPLSVEGTTANGGQAFSSSLPHTGDKQSSMSLWAGLVVLFGSLLGGLGLYKRGKHQA